MTPQSNSVPSDIEKQIALLNEQSKLVERLAGHAKQLINVYRANEIGFTNKFSVDWSEIFGYCFPLEDAKNVFDIRGKAGYDETLRAGLADALLFSMPGQVILLPPHLVELRGAVARLTRSGIKRGAADSDLVEIWKNELNRIRESGFVKDALKQFRENPSDIPPETILRIAKYHMKDSYILVQLLSGSWSEGLKRLRLLGENNTLAFWNQTFEFVVDEKKIFTEGVSLARKIADFRSSKTKEQIIQHRDYLDGIAAEYIREINSQALKKKKILFFLSRSDAMRKAVNEQLRVSINLGYEIIQIETFWTPDRLIAFEVFKEGDDWLESQKGASAFCDTTNRFLSLIKDLRRGQVRSPDPSATLAAALDQFEELKDALDKFENLRLSRISPDIASVDNIVKITPFPISNTEQEFFGFIRTFFSLLENNEDLQRKIRDAVESLLSEINQPSRIIEEVIGAGKDVKAIELVCSGPQKHDQNYVAISGWVKEMPLELHFYTDSGKENAYQICTALKSSLSDGFKYFIEMIVRKKSLGAEERLLVALIYAALSNTHQALSELREVIALDLNTVTSEALYLTALIDMALTSNTHQLNLALSTIDFAIKKRPEEWRYYFTKSIALWRIARHTHNVKGMDDVIETTKIAGTMLLHDTKQLARYYNNLAYWEVEMASSFADQLSKSDVERHLLIARENIEKVFSLIPEDELDGDYHHTRGKILLTLLKYEQDPTEKKHLKEQAYDEFQLAINKKVANWNSGDLHSDLFDLTSYH